MAETFTELYPGIGGSKMDERSVPNTAAGGTAHRATIVPGADDGRVQTFTTDGARVEGDVRLTPSSTAVRTTVMAATTNILLLDVNASRKRAFVFNHSNSVLHIGLGATPTDADNFTYIIPSENLWEIPERFIGQVHGHWLVADGSARMTELT